MTELLTEFGKVLEAALNEKAPLKAQRVFNLQLVTAKDFYGFHPEDQVFIKVVLYYARDISKAGEMLQVERECFEWSDD